MKINTDRLILREFKYDDLSAVHKYASNPEVVKYFEWGPNSEKETKEFINKASEAQYKDSRLKYELAVTIDEKLIGGCNITITDKNNRQAFIGYCFNKDYWGQGYATETAEALLDFGFNKLKMHRIFATCDVDNVGSRKVLKKVGMKKEGYLREHKKIDGEWRDSYLYSILEGEYF